MNEQADMLIAYIVCQNLEQARDLGRRLLSKKLCACVNIFPEVQSMFFWPARSEVIDESKEVIVIAKTIEAKYQQLEDEVHAGSIEIPCVFSIPVRHVAKKYYAWVMEELA